MQTAFLDQGRKNLEPAIAGFHLIYQAGEAKLYLTLKDPASPLDPDKAGVKDCQ